MSKTSEATAVKPTHSTGSARDFEWPDCTTHPYDCGHVTRHATPGDARAFAEQHTSEYVNRNGYAVCACHPEAEAEALGVTRFPCGVRQ